MTKRKIVLLSVCALLLCIYIAQHVCLLNSGTKTVALDDKIEIDTIKLASVTGEYTLDKSGDGWTVSAAKYPAAQSAVDNMLGALKTINVLDTVGKSGAANDERYELGGEKAVTVTASGDGKVLRKIVIGKSASTMSQTYVVLDDSHDVVLVSGNVRDTFNKTVEELRSKLIYKLDTDKLRKVTVTYEGATLSYEKAADSPEWKSVNGTPECDSDKVSSWASQLYSVSAAAWLDDDAVLPDTPVATTRIESEGDFATLNIYKEDGAGGGEAKYYCTSSATPYKAELSSYAAGKYTKSASDFAKDK